RRGAPVDTPRVVVGKLSPETDHLLAETVLAKPCRAGAERRSPALLRADRGIDDALRLVTDDASLLEETEGKPGDEVDAAEPVAAAPRERLERDERALGARIETVEEADLAARYALDAVTNLDGVAGAPAAQIAHAKLDRRSAPREQL